MLKRTQGVNHHRSPSFERPFHSGGTLISGCQGKHKLAHKAMRKRTEEPRSSQTAKQRMFAQNLRWACECMGYRNIKEAAAGLGVGYAWLRRAVTRGVERTRRDNQALDRLSQFFDVPKDSFWGDQNDTFRKSVLRIAQPDHVGHSVTLEVVLRHYRNHRPKLLVQCLDVISHYKVRLEDPSIESPEKRFCIIEAGAKDVIPDPTTWLGELRRQVNETKNARTTSDATKDQVAAHAQHTLIKWTGSKRLQAGKIVAQFPRQIETYYEPFLGGASVLFELLHSDIEVGRFEVSDLCGPLIDLWRVVAEDPDSLIRDYIRHWRRLQKRGASYYYDVRREYNQDNDPYRFFFLLRTCRNGLVRFNAEGKFNPGFHGARPGMSPKRVVSILKEWERRLASKDVRFRALDYRRITAQPGDFLYLDPPYLTKDARYYQGQFDLDKFFVWLKKQPCDYVFSLNGFLGDQDRKVDVPKDLFNEHILLDNGVSPFDRLNGMKALPVRDSLYVKRRQGWGSLRGGR